MKKIKCFVVNSQAITSESKHLRTRATFAMIVATSLSCQNPKVICTMAYRYRRAVTEVGRLIRGLDKRATNIASAIPAFAPAALAEATMLAKRYVTAMVAGVHHGRRESKAPRSATDSPVTNSAGTN